MWKRLLVLFCLSALVLTAQQITAVNAAGYTRDFAPGGLISIFGTDLASATELAGGTPLPTTLAGASVEATDGVNTWQLPLYMASPGQINAQLPYGVMGALTLRVVTPSGTSEPDAINLVLTAPTLFAWNEGGFGRAVVTHQNGDAVTRQNPVIPGEYVTFWVNSLGEVTPAAEAGAPANDGSAGQPLQEANALVSVAIDGQAGNVTFAGLTPLFAGLYQVDALSPYSDVIGDVEAVIGADGVPSQGNISVPIKPNGFYWALPASKFPNGQTRNAISGPNTSIFFYHEDQEQWGNSGFQQWTSNNQATGGVFSAVSGLAFTLMSGDGIVFDNNGIEDGTHGGFYDNRGTGIPDAGQVALTQWFNMSGNFKAVYATHFRVPQATTFDTLIAYFDGNGTAELRFDPENIYNNYRMNIWSSNLVGNPAIPSFTGNVLSSDTTPGQFSIARTDVSRFFSDGGEDPIYRVVFTLDQPVTLSAGEYWFGSDVQVPESPRGGAEAAESEVRRMSNRRRALPESLVLVEP